MRSQGKSLPPKSERPRQINKVTTYHSKTHELKTLGQQCQNREMGTAIDKLLQAPSGQV